MLKPVIVATAALAIAGSSIVYAQQHFDGPGGSADGAPRFEHRHRPSVAGYGGFYRRPDRRAQGRSRTYARPGEELAGVRAGAARHGPHCASQRMQARQARRSAGADTRPRRRRSIGCRGGPTA